MLITDILQEACPGDQITKAVVLVLGQAILFFGRCSCKEGLLYRNAQDIELGLKGHANWAGRTAQVEATVNTMQEGCGHCSGEINKIQRPRVPLRVKESLQVLSCCLWC